MEEDDDGSGSDHTRSPPEREVPWGLQSVKSLYPSWKAAIMRVIPRVWIGLAIYLGYCAVIVIVTKLGGVPFP